MLNNVLSTLIGICIGIGVSWWIASGFYDDYHTSSEGQRRSVEQHELCFDTTKYEAWVAYKDGELRCFTEQRSYPHRVKASYIDEYRKPN